MVKQVSSLIDPSTGKPIEYELLNRDIAAPTTAGVRNIMSDHPAQGLTPWRLTQILRAAEQGDADAQHDLAEEIEEKDLHYQSVLGTRKRAVTQLDKTVLAAGDDDRSQKDADLVRDFLKRPTLEDELFDIMDALGKGFSVTQVIWDTTKIPWLPKVLERVDPRYFQFDQTDGKTLRLKGGPDGDTAMATDLPSFKFLLHTNPAKSGLAIRGGLIRGIAWAYLFKNIALKDWTIFAEVYGMPIRVGKYDKSATLDDRNALLNAVRSIATDAAAIIPASMMIEFVNGMAAGNYQVYHELLKYLDQLISKAVLGQTATTDAVAGGLGGSQGTVHNDVREDIQHADAVKLAVTVNLLVQWIIDLNHGPPPGGNYPQVLIGAAELFTAEDMDKLERFIKLGGRVEESVVRDKLGYPDPPEKDKDGKPVRLLGVPQESPPTTPEDVSGAPAGAGKPKAASMAALKALNSPLNSDGTPQAAPSDAIDRLVDMTADGWVEVMAPMIGPIEASLSAATSIEDFRDGLIGLLEKMDAGKMTELMARAAFNARLAGEAGLDVTGDAS